MIKIPYELLKEEEFEIALLKLERQPMGMKFAYQFSKIIQPIRRAISMMKAQQRLLVLKHFEIENGKVKIDENGQVVYKEGSSRETFEKESQELSSQTLEIERDALDMEAIGEDTRLTPEDLIYLSPLFEQRSPFETTAEGATSLTH